MAPVVLDDSLTAHRTNGTQRLPEGPKPVRCGPVSSLIGPIQRSGGGLLFVLRSFEQRVRSCVTFLPEFHPRILNLAAAHRRFPLSLLPTALSLRFFYAGNSCAER
jgi:hypothetical protein